MNHSTTITIPDASLSNEENRPTPVNLWQRYHQCKDSKAENELIEQYLPLLKTIVGRLAMTLPAHIRLDDLYSAGLLGLLQAVRNFDAQGGASFETFARFRIRGAVFDELRRMDWVPRLIHDRARKVQNVMSDLEQRNGTTPNEAQMAAALNISLDEYHRWLEEIRPATYVCLDAAIHPDTGDPATQYESVQDDTQEDPLEHTSREELKDMIIQCINKLPDIQRKVLSLYYIEDLRLREIAAVFGLTESRISQIHSQAILAIRASIERSETQKARSATLAKV